MTKECLNAQMTNVTWTRMDTERGAAFMPLQRHPFRHREISFGDRRMPVLKRAKARAPVRARAFGHSDFGHSFVIRI
jgi:hypothetical protein